MRGSPAQVEDIKLVHCRFQELKGIAGIELGSVDLVLTDFPYKKASLPQIAELAEFAARVFKDRGLFVTYSGNYYLDKVMNDLG